MARFISFSLFVCAVVLCACSSQAVHTARGTPDTVMYPAYKNLVMAGYQGWFNAPNDGATGRGWGHYGFHTGDTLAYVDFWPDMEEYAKKYVTPFKMPDGSPSYVYSPFDEDSVDVHFRWMQEYGIDGVWMQRFVTDINSPHGEFHFNRVLGNALRAARKYGRAIGIMYDLSGCNTEYGIPVSFIENDWVALESLFQISDPNVNPTYVWHNDRPMVAIWGVGFSSEARQYTTLDVRETIINLKAEHDLSIMLGVPYYWRTLDQDAESRPEFHDLIRDYADVIMPWAVGRYNNNSYPRVAAERLREDILWCIANNVDYVPLVFPGFSWGNLRRNPALYHETPRLGGEFYWNQIAGAMLAGAESLYFAMFDEIDEGTSIFKVKRESEVPVFASGSNLRFVGIEDHLPSDHYLWLAGEARKWLRGGTGYSTAIPVRQ